MRIVNHFGDCLYIDDDGRYVSVFDDNNQLTYDGDLRGLVDLLRARGGDVIHLPDADHDRNATRYLDFDGEHHYHRSDGTAHYCPPCGCGDHHVGKPITGHSHL